MEAVAGERAGWPSVRGRGSLKADRMQRPKARDASVRHVPLFTEPAG